MLYDCLDIERLLESGEDISLDSFEEHLAGCLHCRKLVHLDPELEEHLQTYLPGTSPPSVCENVMNSVSKDESFIHKGRRWELALPFIAIVITCSFAALVITKLNEIKSLFSSIDRIFLGAPSLGLLSKLKLPALEIEQMISHMGNEPFIFATSFAAAALIWALSLLELEKTAR